MVNIIVVGSGAGGGSIARELAKNGVNVTIIDKGPIIRSRNAFKCYETIPDRSGNYPNLLFGRHHHGNHGECGSDIPRHLQDNGCRS